MASDYDSRNVHVPVRSRRFLGIWFVTFTLLLSSFAGSARASDDPAATSESTEQVQVVAETSDETAESLETEPQVDVEPAPDTTNETGTETETQPEPVVDEPVIQEETQPATGQPDTHQTDSDNNAEEPTTIDQTESSDDTTEITDSADESTASEPTPEPEATLAYLAAPHPVCTLASDGEAIVASGAYLDYDCVYQVELDAAHINDSTIEVEWRVKASLADGWSVQYLPPVTPSDSDPEWTKTQIETATLRHETRIQLNATDSLETTETIAFGLRIHRAACERNETTIKLAGSVTVSAPEVAVDIRELANDATPLKITPALAPIPEPSLSFSGSLNFGSIPVDAYGVQQPPEPQFITVTVSDLDHACGD